MKKPSQTSSLKRLAGDGQAPMNDPLSDMIARIKNAATRKRTKVSTPASKLRARVLDVLADEGYIRGYSLVEKPGAFPEFEIELKYFDGEPIVTEINRVSKPGRRIYASIKDVKPIKNALGVTNGAFVSVSENPSSSGSILQEIRRPDGRKTVGLSRTSYERALSNAKSVLAKR